MCNQRTYTFFNYKLYVLVLTGTYRYLLVHMKRNPVHVLEKETVHGKRKFKKRKHIKKKFLKIRNYKNFKN